MNLTTVCVVVVALMAAAPATEAAVIVNDSWADGDRAKTGLLDSNWWTSASSSGIEVSTGSLGLVTGSSGRGIHTVFPTQTLANVGDTLIATYIFTTPDTVGTNRSTAFRVGLFDTLGRAGLDDDVSSSSSSPSDLYGWGTLASPPGPGTAGLPGYMMDMDVNLNSGEDDISFREHDTGTLFPTGRLMGTTDAFNQLSPTGPDGAFTFTPNTPYAGSFSITRVSATEFELTGTLNAATHSVTDVFDSDQFGMLQFWANSNTFGSSNTPGEPDNGIDFSNVTITFIPIPEPTSLLLLCVSGLFLACRRPSRMHC